MAKEDFCFTYYDGDAARDKAHMTRLERGAYDDIISAQRKRGHLSTEDLKRVLGSDFEQCWPSLEWVLKKDNEGKFYIEWLDTSIEKMRQHSEKQKSKAVKRWHTDSNTDSMPRHNNSINTGVPLVNENGDGNENSEGETWNTMPGSEALNLELPEIKAGAVIQFFKISKNQDATMAQVSGLWDVFKVQNLTGKKVYQSDNDVFSHFINWCQKKDVSKVQEIQAPVVSADGLTARERHGKLILKSAYNGTD